MATYDPFAREKCIPVPPQKAAGKSIYFTLEGLNSFAATLYLYYIYFYLRDNFGFTNKQNLVCAAFGGSIYMLGSWVGGRFAQKRGYLTSVTVGFTGMLLALLAGAQLTTALGQISMLCLYIASMSFTWPALEALVSENEPRKNLTRMVGLYNLVWAGTAGLANFAGGAILEGTGKSFFYLPAGIHLVQIAVLFLSRRGKSTPAKIANPVNDEPHPVPNSRLFLRLAWVANPFAYVAINSLIPMIPFIAHKLELTPMLAGFFCSIWLFARFGAFWLLWVWHGWHYRQGYLLGAYSIMVLCFGAMLLSTNLLLLILAQAGFGITTGLIYYSSLYYSMDVGDTKGEHGGLHEAAIGVGNMAGPGLSAAALAFWPASAQSGTWAVCALLILGFTSMLVMGRKSPATITSPSAEARAVARIE